MTKRKSKSTKTTVKAAAAKGSVRRSSTAPATALPPLIVLGFDDQQKPRGARFVDAKPDLVTKADLAATKTDLEAAMDRLENRLRTAIEQTAHQQTVRFFGMMLGVVGLMNAILFALLRVVH